LDLEEKMIKKILIVMLMLVAVLALVACGGTPEVSAPADEAVSSTTEEQPAAEEPAPAERKVATFIWTQEFDTLNPMYSGMWFVFVTYDLWNAPAWIFDKDNAPQPNILTEMPSEDNGGITDEGRTITLKLRDGIQWSDGTPITANDFVFTYNMIMDPGNIVQSTYPYDQLTDVTAADDQTVVMTFAEPFAPWLTMWRYLLPEHVLQPVFEAEGSLDEAAWNLAPTVGAGPYVFDEWESGSFARFVRNDNYYNDPPLIDEIFFRFVPDDASQTAALVTGDGDLGTFIPYSDVPTLEEAGVKVISVPSGYNEGWFFFFGEDGHPAVKDVNVRKAIALAFDRFALSDDLLLGLTEPAATLWDNMPYVDPAIEPYPYDPDEANRLLDEAGWVDSNGDGTRDKDGVELVLTHGTTIREIRQDAQAVAQQQLAEVGIGLEIQSYDADIFFGGYADDGPAATGQLDIFEWSDGPAVYPDPDHYYWYCSEIPTADYPDGGNWQYLCDEDLEALFALQATQTDFAERQQTFYEITNYMFDNVIWLGLWHDPDLWALSDRLTNVEMSGSSPFYNIAQWDLTN
jgi:peptide/nickel transport system substrate-binding protein